MVLKGKVKSKGREKDILDFLGDFGIGIDMLFIFEATKTDPQWQ